jgi:class 3 adenylate cyclase
VTFLVGGLMVAMNVAVFVLLGRAGTIDEQHRIDTSANVLTLIAAMTLIVGLGADAFDRLAAPLVMVIAVFAFVQARLRFVFASVAAVVYLVTFVAAATAVGVTPSLLQLFLVTAAVLVALVGAYRYEVADRRLYAARREIAQLSARLDELLRRYLSPGLASSIIDRPDLAELGGRVVEVTILFADVQGFTPFAEVTDPAATVERLNECYGAAVPAVLGEGGTVVGYAGDALMAIFNAPNPLPSHALSAARAALAFRSATGALESGGLRVRIGLESGPALVGNVGSAELRNFTAIGDTPNVAARLQSSAAPGTIVIGPGIRALLGDSALTRDLGPLDLKGKSAPVPAWELLALIPAVAALPADQSA